MSMLVLDCSVTIAWFMDDEGSKSLEILDLVVESGAIVPSIWSLEVANVLLKAERNKRINRQQRVAAIHTLKDLPIITDANTTNHAWLETIELADMYDLSVYDTSYLELALRKGLQLATYDQQLIKAASKAGLHVV